MLTNLLNGYLNYKHITRGNQLEIGDPVCVLHYNPSCRQYLLRVGNVTNVKPSQVTIQSIPGEPHGIWKYSPKRKFSRERGTLVSLTHQFKKEADLPHYVFKRLTAWKHINLKIFCEIRSCLPRP
jgi:hypothetical protein